MPKGRNGLMTKRRAGLVSALLMIIAVMMSGCARPGEAEKDAATGAKPAAKSGGTPTATSASASVPETIASIESKLAEFRGKVVILDLWATWCGPCIREIPGFIRLQNKYRDRGLEIVGVSVDQLTRGWGANVVGPFMQKYGINYTIWLLNDPNGFGKYPMGTGIPTTYIIDRSGRATKVYVGAQAESLFESEIQALL
jgi:thiol-disulfide isomerase/thioredoxin